MRHGPDLLTGLGEGAVWLLDPLDGTSNFAGGKRPFSVMLALLQDGEAVASWMLDPVSGDMCIAEQGSGAILNGRPVTTDQTVPSTSELKGAVLSKFMPAEVKTGIESKLASVAAVPGLLCAGAEYPEIAFGTRHFAIYWRTLPWDHVPGALFLKGAGGFVGRLDGSAYRADSQGSGLIAATNAAVAETIISLIDS